MYCSKCGTHCPEDALFCHRCGYELYQEPVSQQILPEVPLPEEIPTIEPVEELLPEPCGEEVPEEELVQEETVEAESDLSEEELLPGEVITPVEEDLSRGRRSLWIGLGVMLAMIVVGTLCWLFLPTERPEEPVAEDQIGWFSVDSDGCLTFLEEQYSGGSELVVPETVGGVPVTALADDCFANADGLISIKLPESMTYIGSHAFAGCTDLRGIYLPKQVAVISSGAFSGCTALEAISCSNSVAEIAPDAFENCPKLFYIFFQGTCEEWAARYHSYITPYTKVMCTDGAIYQPAA